jgi:hypothetical protein
VTFVVLDVGDNVAQNLNRPLGGASIGDQTLKVADNQLMDHVPHSRSQLLGDLLHVITCFLTTAYNAPSDPPLAVGMQAAKGS